MGLSLGENACTTVFTIVLIRFVTLPQLCAHREETSTSGQFRTCSISIWNHLNIKITRMSHIAPYDRLAGNTEIGKRLLGKMSLPITISRIRQKCDVFCSRSIAYVILGAELSGWIALWTRIRRSPWTSWIPSAVPKPCQTHTLGTCEWGFLLTG